MLKRQSKMLSVAMIFVFCMSFMFVGFAPQTAEAATMYQVIKAPTVTPASPAVAQNIGAVVKVTIPDMAVAADSILTVSMPSEWTFPGQPGYVANISLGTVDVINPATATGSAVEILAAATGTSATGDGLLELGDFAAAGSYAIKPNNTFDIQLAAALASTGADNYFYIYFNGVNLNNSAGDLKVTFLAPSGSAFETALDVVIGKSTRSGATTSTIKDVREISGNGTLDIISVLENSAGTIKPGTVANPGTIKLKILTKGFTWDTPLATTVASYGWDYSGVIVGPPADTDFITAGMVTSPKVLDYPINAAIIGAAPYANPGRISFANLPIEVDDTVVKAGTELEVELSGADMTKQTLTVAKFVDFGLTVAEGTSIDALAGQNGVKVGNFFINESAAGSWIANRTITLGLPTGAQWDTVGDIDVVNSSDIGAITGTISGTNSEFVKLTLAAASTTSGAQIELSDFKVDLAPDFDGPVNVTVTGNAGVTGELKIADAKPIAAIEVAEVKDIEIGRPNQQIGDITLVESIAEGFLNNGGAGNEIRLVLDNGYRFAKEPTVEVTEGDLDITTSGIVVNENILTIPVKSQSSKTAAKILISDIYVDAYRTAPEGKVTIKFDNGLSALNELNLQFPNEYPGKAVVANCVTPAPGEKVGNGEFRIDSNIYYVAGVAKVMDVAPYIKASRTYVPMRYLGEILGAEVVWDATAQTVTLTQGDINAVFTIGSTSYTVNGETKVADVAPEIVNSRTMLPARFVAEAFGAVVGWDPSTRQVVISK